MTPFDRLTWVASFVAPLVGWLILVLFGAFVSQEAVPAPLISPKAAAWLSALLVLVWLASHLTVRFHSRRASGLRTPCAAAKSRTPRFHAWYSAKALRAPGANSAAASPACARAALRETPSAAARFCRRP